MRTRQLDRTRTIWIVAAILVIAAGLFFIAGCGALGQMAQIVQPPRFERADRPADIRFIAPSLSNPAGVPASPSGSR